MPPVQTGDPVPELLHMIALIDAAIALVEIALVDVPTPEEERRLRRAKLRLEAERTLLEAELDAALDGDTSVEGPSDDQLSRIVELADKVEQATNNAVAVSKSIALAGRVLDLATAVMKVS